MDGIRRWPWIPSLIAGGVVFALMLLLYSGRPLRGIALASALNMATVAFFLVGGMFFAARLATGRGTGAFVRPLVAGLVTFLGCLIVVLVTRQLTLPDESFGTSLTEDGFGRAIVVSPPAVVVGFIAEAFKRARLAARPSGR
ncbi:hypothetical protein [Sphaerisporangium fuscum]|uniref:hypothetical protein n=1 Tax=Sphaerisporangium fuscum TaxID=2835868 RepID=UPI001BDD8D22|nr:hypothetical protein [Sphaerisporangium fuscum]